jgi:hypothetical protein
MIVVVELQAAAKAFGADNTAAGVLTKSPAKRV